MPATAEESMLYLNGQFIPIEAARISALDRGCLFGDGVYEVIPVYSRHPFRLFEHLKRLAASLESLLFPMIHTPQEWADLIRETIGLQSFDDQSVYLHVTRGAAPFRDFPFPVPLNPTVMIYPTPLVTTEPRVKAAGVRALSHVDFRWLRCDVKSLNLLPTVLMREQAKRADCAEVIFFRDGFLTEGAASNIFVVKDGVILAPPKSNWMLSGITYDLVCELALAHHIPHDIRPISEAEVRGADELWMTSSTKEVLALVALDDVPVGTGQVGPMAVRMDGLYQDFKNTVMRQGDSDE